ncbi:MAG TPA: NRDE family protein [Burkholderiaceae bacterium]|nr:NRDE family protein [Burkholderiaceae bacterium]
MCIAYLALGRHPEWPLFIAANRDEFHARASRPAAPWSDFPNVIAGLDRVAGGTWLGVTRQGRYALLTNYRDPSAFLPNAPSRGQLVGDFLIGHATPLDYAAAVSDCAGIYNGFNLIVGDMNSCFYIGNRAPDASPRSLGPGSHVLSNHLLDTPWPKARRLRQAMDDLALAQLNESIEPVFALLRDGAQADDADLPDTGIPRERERLLSSPFIVSPEYGTRCSTVVAIHASGRAVLSEASYAPDGGMTQRHDWPFEITHA